MSLFGTSGGGNRNAGRGGYHPGAINDTAASSASGSLGTTTVNSSTTSTSVSGQRLVFDPWHNPVQYSIASGSLPPGFTLNANNGQITGSYTPSGINTDGTVYTFTVRATTNNAGVINSTDRTYSVTLSVPWLYRQIITTLYMAGGYQSSSLWSNVNRFPRSTETCTNLGDGLIDNYHYKSGMCDDNRGHIWNGNSTTTFQMRTETKVNGVGAPGYSCANTGTVFAPDRNRSFTIGEGVSNTFRFTASTNAFATLGGGSGDHASGISGENKGIWWSGNGTNFSQKIDFSTEGRATGIVYGGAHGQQKGMSAKTGFGYGGNEGTYAGGYNYRKTNITNETYSTVGKMWGNCGEENYGMSQDNGYMLGQYDDSIGQNNRCGRHVYATDSGAQLGTTVQGHGGASSGHCFWRD